ncbi:hypothetical protein AMTR_s00009p00209360, partial [Amborella trichopoda]
MEAPLLEHSAFSGEDYPAITNCRQARALFGSESRKLWTIAAPIIFNTLCFFALGSTTQMFVGHLGNLELAGVAISSSVISTFTFGFMLGMGSAAETLCGQAFGAGQVEMLGIYLQRSWIILLVTGLFLVPVYVFSTPILVLLGQDRAISNLAGKFTIWTIPQIFALAINFPTQKFLQSQSKFAAFTWIGFIALVIHILLLWVFVWLFGWGLPGAAVVVNVSAWFISIAQTVYVVYWCKDAWNGLSWLAFKDMWAFVRLSLASAVMLCLEVWYMMSLTVLTGHLENPEIAVDSISICMNVNGWEAMIFIGFIAAISVRVSNELGCGHPRAAKISVVVVVITSLIIGIFFSFVILAARDHIAILFTSSDIIQQAVSKLAPILTVTMVLNSIQPVISGVAVGGGWQTLVAYINLACYYIFGLPLGYLLGYKFNMGVK